MLRLRPPTPQDADAAFAVILARDLADLGLADYTPEDLHDDWSASEFNLATDAVVCDDGHGAIVGYAAIRRTHSLAVVDPEHECRGIGAMLLDWVETRERELGRDRHRQGIASTDRRGARLLESAGYRHERSYWRMATSLADPPDEGQIDGATLRGLELPRDAQALYQLDAESFADAPDYVPMSISAFRNRHLAAHDFAPELSAAAAVDGELIGFLLARRWEEDNAGFVDILAVAPAYQGRGVGTALLKRAFRRFAVAGLGEAHLVVASSNPDALRLYERLGMAARFRIDAYERPVAPSTQA